MIDRFLKAKHWQLFLLSFGIPIILQIVMMGSMFSTIASETNPDPKMMFGYMKFFPAIMILFMLIYFGWFWSVGIGLQKKVPEHIKMKVKKFKIFFFIPMVYLIGLIIFISFAMNDLISSGQEPNPALLGSLMAIVIPLHLFSMFCILYTLYFVAKTFKTVELQREVKFNFTLG